MTEALLLWKGEDVDENGADVGPAWVLFGDPDRPDRELKLDGYLTFDEAKAFAELHGYDFDEG
jgi:hypothetical protein